MLHRFENIVTTGSELSSETVKRIQTLMNTHSDTIQSVREYYNHCESHIDFLQKTVYSIRSFLLENGIEYSQKGIQLAKDKIVPLVEKFSTQKKETDKAVQAILYLVMQYIQDSPFNQNICFDKAPLLAVLGVNMFLVTFASAIVAAKGFERVFSNHKSKVEI